MTPAERCSERVVGDRTFTHQCPRRGVLTHDNKLYCKQHYPPNVAEKHAERDRRWKREGELRSMDCAIQDAKAAVVDCACELIATTAGERELRAAVAELNGLKAKRARLKEQP